MESVLNTGKLTDSIQFPLTMEFVRSTSDGKTKYPMGPSSHGHCSAGTMPKFDSIVSHDG